MVEVIISFIVVVAVFGFAIKASLKKKVSSTPISGGGSAPEEPKGPINEQ